MNAALEALMAGLVDYAGLFPPAGLDMPSAVRNYARYRDGAQRAWLGRFVVPTSRLEEFIHAVEPLAPQNGVEATWRISALSGTSLAADVEQLAGFNAEHSGKDGKPIFRIDALEIKAGRAEEIFESMIWIPDSVAPYFEIPIRENPSSLISALARGGARAKVRTGGVTPDAFPSAPDLARFIVECARAKVAFKATAGLHHPVRSLRPLTYEAHAPEAKMYGFLNVFLAGALAQNGAGVEEVTRLLEEESPPAFAFGDDGVSWGNRRLGLSQLQETREGFAASFGSCSFEEPVEDLKSLGWL